MSDQDRPESQSERFKRTARELGADESEERFNERLKRISSESGQNKPERRMDIGR